MNLVVRDVEKKIAALIKPKVVSAVSSRKVMGRPMKFKSVAALQKAIDTYFESCWKEEEIKKGGKVVDTRRYRIRPYTIIGLALALDTSRQTLVNYEQKNDYFDSIKSAKLMCDNYIEEGMLTGTLESTPSIFNMKNNFGWIEEAGDRADQY